MSSKTGLIVALCTAMGPVVILFVLQALNVIATVPFGIMGTVAVVSFASAAVIGIKSGN